MPFGAKLIITAAGLVSLICLIKMLQSGHFFKALSTSVLSGLGSLFAVNLLSGITGVSVAVNWFTMIFCAFSGICGSICLLIGNIFI
ncbi:MAG: pro-sigmaK processing inhibitor BofA family protein [Acutalibacteraceae bacterium]